MNRPTNSGSQHIMSGRGCIKEVGRASDDLRFVNSALIVAAARRRFFDCGYSALTMDDLAAELGMSKKTIYRHFASKDELIEKIVDLFASEVRALASSVSSDKSRESIAKLHQFMHSMALRLGDIKPHVLRDLNRFAPHIARKFEELRNRTMPQELGVLFRQCQIKGVIRNDLDVEFAVEFWRTAIDGMMQSATTERLGVTPGQLVAQSIDLFFADILTRTGRKDHERHVASGLDKNPRRLRKLRSRQFTLYEEGE